MEKRRYRGIGSNRKGLSRDLMDATFGLANGSAPQLRRYHLAYAKRISPHGLTRTSRSRPPKEPSNPAGHTGQRFESEHNSHGIPIDCPHGHGLRNRELRRRVSRYPYGVGEIRREKMENRPPVCTRRVRPPLHGPQPIGANRDIRDGRPVNGGRIDDDPGFAKEAIAVVAASRTKQSDQRWGANAQGMSRRLTHLPPCTGIDPIPDAGTPETDETPLAHRPGWHVRSTPTYPSRRMRTTTPCAIGLAAA